jgi:hypothetical protein
VSDNVEPQKRICQWCGEEARADATHCAACGAALPLLVPIDELRVVGVTDVDPDLKVYEKGPLRIPTGSPTQQMAGRVMGAAALGGPGAILAAGAIAAVAANEFGSAGRGHAHGSALDVGQPSEASLEIAKRLQLSQRKKNLLPPPPPPPPLTPGDEAAG